MLPKAEERQTDLRNTSIMEVILAVIIVLLLVVHTKDVQIGELKKDYEHTIAELQKENSTLRDKNKRLISEKNKLIREVKDLKSQLDYYEQFIGEDGQSVADLNKKLAKENARMKKELERLKEKLLALEKENAEMRKKYGVGAPRCKANDEKVQWLAKIEKVDNQFQFEMLAPMQQQVALIRTVPGLKTLVDKKILSKNQFYASALQVYNWGNSQPIKCRFYVKVVKDSLDEVDEYLFIQSFFYTGVTK